MNGTIDDGTDGVWVDTGTVITPRCLNGLVLNDSTQVTCNNGTWNIIPRCVPGKNHNYRPDGIIYSCSVKREGGQCTWVHTAGCDGTAEVKQTALGWCSTVRRVPCVMLTVRHCTVNLLLDFTQR